MHFLPLCVVFCICHMGCIRDIPFLGHTIGWHNYKFVAKKELERVPILGKAIKVAKNVLVDRTNRRSQFMTLKQGMKWLDVSAAEMILHSHQCLFKSLHCNYVLLTHIF